MAQQEISAWLKADPWSMLDWFVPGSIEVPPIIEFVLSDKYLNRPYLWPAQGTLLKIMCNQIETFTSYDFDLVDRWTKGFTYPEAQPTSTEPLTFLGSHGLTPDVLDRMEWLTDHGYPWFREVVNITGRRGGKGFLGGIMGAYVTWNYIAMQDPQGTFGISPEKAIGLMVFAQSKEDAKAQQWSDIVNVITSADCFSKYISRPQAESLSLYAPQDFVRQAQMDQRGIESSRDTATFQVLPRSSAPKSGRGPSAMAVFFDEIAHAVQTTKQEGMDNVYDAATPALDQFKKWAFIYLGSTPWERVGKLWERYQEGLKLDPKTLDPYNPTTLVIQLESWAPYTDWRKTHERLIAQPELRGKSTIYFSPVKGALQEYNDDMRRLERANPESFAVERRSNFARTKGAYLPAAQISRVFDRYGGALLKNRRQGPLSFEYEAHGDPGHVNDRFAFCVGHKVYDETDGMFHAVIDYITTYDPADEEWTLAGGGLNTELVIDDIWEIVRGFWPRTVTFDQFNSVTPIQILQRRITEVHVPRAPEVYIEHATRASNWQKDELTKSAITLGLVHAPFHEILDQEMAFLRKVAANKVDHPSSGPVQTKDAWDAFSTVVARLLKDDLDAYMSGLDSKPTLGLQGGLPSNFEQAGSALGASSMDEFYGGKLKGQPRGW